MMETQRVVMVAPIVNVTEVGTAHHTLKGIDQHVCSHVVMVCCNRMRTVRTPTLTQVMVAVTYVKLN